MLTLVLIKIVADLALYYTFAGFIASSCGASGAGMLLALSVQAVALTIAYAARRFGLRRFLPMLLPVLYFFLPGTTAASLVVMVPPVLYEFYLIYHNIYEPDWSQQAGIFSVFWKVFLVFSFFCAVAGAADPLRDTVLPFGIVTLMCSVLLLRSLRHDPQVYCQITYQALNLALLCAVGLCTMFLSSHLFLDACLGLLHSFYNWVISPVLMALIYLLAMVVKGILLLLSFLNLQAPAYEMEQQITEETVLGIFASENETVSSNGIRYIAIAIVVLAAALVLIRVFRALAGRGKARLPERKIREVRVRLSSDPKQKSGSQPGSPAGRVRAQYKKFLRLTSARSLGPEISDTSLDVTQKSRGVFDDDAVRELRDLYIEARYDQTASAEMVQQSKKLYAKIKKSTNDRKT